MNKVKSTAQLHEDRHFKTVGTIVILVMGLWLALMLNTSFVNANTIKVVITK